MSGLTFTATDTAAFTAGAFVVGMGSRIIKQAFIDWRQARAFRRRAAALRRQNAQHWADAHAANRAARSCQN